MHGIVRFGLLCSLFLCMIASTITSARAEQCLTQAEFEAQGAPLIGLPGKTHELIKLSDAALDACTDNDPAYAALAHGYKSHALWLRNDYARAEAEARQAVSADSGAALSYFFLADALNAQLRYDDAYLACLHGAERRGDAAKQGEARTRCRNEYVRRVTMDPTTVLKAAKNGRLPVNGNGNPEAGRIFVSGRISAVDTSQGKGVLVFVCDAGTLTCRLAPNIKNLQLAPMTAAESGKHSSPAAGLQPNQFVTIRGIVRTVADNSVFMDTCELFTH